MKPRLTAEARLDLLEIWNFIAQREGVPLARHVLARLRADINDVGKRPELGHRRPDLTDLPVLFVTSQRWYIIYRADTEPPRIVHITDAARDIRAVLGQ